MLIAPDKIHHKDKFSLPAKTQRVEHLSFIAQRECRRGVLESGQK